MSKLTDMSLMPFGQHKGEKMVNVPASYLLFISEQDWIIKWPDVYRYIHEHEQLLIDEANREKNFQ